MTAYLLECYPFNALTASNELVAFSNGLPDDGYLGRAKPYTLRLQNDFSVETSIFDGNVPGTTSISLGNLSLNNADGSLDYLLGYSWGAAKIVVKQGPSNGLYSDFVPIFTGSALDVTASANRLTIVLRDSGWKLTEKLQSNTYLGSGGTEGYADLAGAPKPLAYALCKNMSPVIVDNVLLYYQVHDGPVEAILAVFDDGVPLSLFQNYANSAALSAAGIPEGSYATCLSEGLIRLGAPAAGTITADVQGQYSSETNLSAILHRILNEKVGIPDQDLDLDSFAELASDVPYVVSGLYYPDTDIQVDQFLDSMLGMVDGFWYVSTDGKVTVGKFKFRASVKEIRAEDIVGLERLSSAKPVFKTQVNYDKNSTIQDPSSLVLADGDLKFRFQNETLFLNGPTFAGSTKMIVTLGETVLNDLGVLNFTKGTNVSWAKINQKGEITITDTGAAVGEESEVSFRASYEDRSVSGVLKIKKIAGNQSLSLSISEPTFKMTPDAQPKDPAQVITITKSSPGLAGPFAWSATDSLNRPILLTTVGENRSISVGVVKGNRNVSYINVTVSGNGLTNSVRIPLSYTDKNVPGAIEDAGSADNGQIVLSNLDYSNEESVREAKRQLTLAAATGTIVRTIKAALYQERLRLSTEMQKLVLYAGRLYAQSDYVIIDAKRVALEAADAELTSYLESLNNYNSDQFDTAVTKETWSSKWSAVYDALYSLYSQIGIPSYEDLSELVKDGRLDPSDKRRYWIEYTDLTYRHYSISQRALKYNVDDTSTEAAFADLQDWVEALQPPLEDFTSITVVSPDGWTAKKSFYEAAYLELSQLLDSVVDGSIDSSLKAWVASDEAKQLGNSATGPNVIWTNGSYAGGFHSQAFFKPTGEAWYGIGDGGATDYNSTNPISIDYGFHWKPVSGGYRLYYRIGNTENEWPGNKLFTEMTTVRVDYYDDDPETGGIQFLVPQAAPGFVIAVPLIKIAKAKVFYAKAILLQDAAVEGLFHNATRAIPFFATTGPKPAPDATSGSNLTPEMYGGGIVKQADGRWKLVNGIVSLTTLGDPESRPLNGARAFDVKVQDYEAVGNLNGDVYLAFVFNAPGKGTYAATLDLRKMISGKVVVPPDAVGDSNTTYNVSLVSMSTTGHILFRKPTITADYTYTPPAPSGAPGSADYVGSSGVPSGKEVFSNPFLDKALTVYSGFGTTTEMGPAGFKRFSLRANSAVYEAPGLQLFPDQPLPQVQGPDAVYFAVGDPTPLGGYTNRGLQVPLGESYHQATFAALPAMLMTRGTKYTIRVMTVDPTYDMFLFTTDQPLAAGVSHVTPVLNDLDPSTQAATASANLTKIDLGPVDPEGKKPNRRWHEFTFTLAEESVWGSFAVGRGQDGAVRLERIHVFEQPPTDLSAFDPSSADKLGGIAANAGKINVNEAYLDRDPTWYAVNYPQEVRVERKSVSIIQIEDKLGSSPITGFAMVATSTWVSTGVGGRVLGSVSQVATTEDGRNFTRMAYYDSNSQNGNPWIGYRWAEEPNDKTPAEAGGPNLVANTMFTGAKVGNFPAGFTLMSVVVNAQGNIVPSNAPISGSIIDRPDGTKAIRIVWNETPTNWNLDSKAVYIGIYLNDTGGVNNKGLYEAGKYYTVSYNSRGSNTLGGKHYMSVGYNLAGVPAYPAVQDQLNSQEFSALASDVWRRSATLVGFHVNQTNALSVNPPTTQIYSAIQVEGPGWLEIADIQVQTGKTPTGYSPKETSVKSVQLEDGTQATDTKVVTGVGIAAGFKDQKLVSTTGDFKDLGGDTKPQIYVVGSFGNGVAINNSAPAGFQQGFWRAAGAQLGGVSRSYVVAWYNKTSKTWSFPSFDVYANASQALAMANFLNGLPNGTPLVVYGVDEPRTNRLTNGLPAAMYRCGASRSRFGKLTWRSHGAYILIGTAGSGEGRAVMEVYKDGNADLSPESWLQVAFTMLADGTLTGQSQSIATASELVFDTGRSVGELVGVPVDADNTSSNVAAGIKFQDPIATTGDYQYVKGETRPANNATADLTFYDSQNSFEKIGNTVKRRSGSGYGWNRINAYVNQQIGNGAIVSGEFLTGNQEFIGFSINGADEDTYSALEYSLFASGGTVHIYTGANGLGNTGVSSSGVWSLTYDRSKVRAYRNGILVYTYPGVPGQNVVMTAGFNAYNELGGVKNIRFNPYNDSTFEALGGLGKAQAEIVTLQGVAASVIGQQWGATADRNLLDNRDVPQGAQLNADPEFSGNLINDYQFGNTQGGVYSVYNNAGSGRVKFTLETGQADAPNGTGRVLVINYDGAGAGQDSDPTPGYGGFTTSMPGIAANLPSRQGYYRPGTTVYFSILAKIPVGRSIGFHSNQIGSGTVVEWLGSTQGTGNYTRYIHRIIFGSSGTFSTTGFFAVHGGPNTAFNWKVARHDILEANSTATFAGPDLRDPLNGTALTTQIIVTENGVAAGFKNQKLISTTADFSDLLGITKPAPSATADIVLEQTRSYHPTAGIGKIEGNKITASPDQGDYWGSFYRSRAYLRGACEARGRIASGTVGMMGLTVTSGYGSTVTGVASQYAALKYAWFQHNGGFQIYENGGFVGFNAGFGEVVNGVTMNPGIELEVRDNSFQVEYWAGGKLMYTSTQTYTKNEVRWIGLTPANGAVISDVTFYAYSDVTAENMVTMPFFEPVLIQSSPSGVIEAGIPFEKQLSYYFGNVDVSQLCVWTMQSYGVTATLNNDASSPFRGRLNVTALSVNEGWITVTAVYRNIPLTRTIRVIKRLRAPSSGDFFAYPTYVNNYPTSQNYQDSQPYEFQNNGDGSRPLVGTDGKFYLIGAASFSLNTNSPYSQMQIAGKLQISPFNPNDYYSASWSDLGPEVVSTPATSGQMGTLSFNHVYGGLTPGQQVRVRLLLRAYDYENYTPGYNGAATITLYRVTT